MNYCIDTAHSLRQVQDAYTVAAQIFGDSYEDSLAHKKRILKADVVCNLRDVIVASVGKKIIGMLRIVHRKNYLLGNPVQTAGLTSVCVLPQYQRQGIGSQLVNKAVRDIVNREVPLTLIVARRAADGYYPQFGFLGTGLFVTLPLSIQTLVHSTTARLKLVRGFIRDYAPDYAHIYSLTYASIPLSFVRPLSWWTKTQSPLKIQLTNWNVVTVLAEKKLIGYFIANTDTLVEAAFYPQHSTAMVTAVLSYYRQLRKKKMTIRLPVTHPLTQYFACRGNTLSQRSVLHGGHLMRITNACAIKNLLLRHIAAAASRFCRRDFTAVQGHYKVLFKKYNNVSGHRKASSLLKGILKPYSKASPLKIKEQFNHTWAPVDEF